MEKLILVVGSLNFVVEFILLMAVDRLSGYPSQRWKKLTAAAVAGLHSGLCLLPEFSSLGSVLCRWGLLLGLGLFMYAFRPKLLPRLALMLLLNFAVEGFQQFADQDQLLSFASAGVLVAMICVLCFREGVSGRYVEVELSYQGKWLRLTALADTGNTLRDPISGDPVVIVSDKVAFQLTGLTRQQLAAPLETMEEHLLPGLRLIPYHCVGCDNGMLLAMRFPQAKIGGKDKDLLVAFAPAGVGKEGTFQALAGGIL